MWRASRVFDRGAKAAQVARAALMPEATDAVYLRESLASNIADRLLDIKRTFDHAAEVGAFKGRVAERLSPDNVKNILLCDSNERLLNLVEAAEGINSTKRVMDEENVKFEPNSLDLIVCSLGMHWVNDLPNFFDRVIEGLKSDGVFIASLFGEDTLFELRSSLQLADLERNGGIAPRVSPLTRIRDIGGLMNSSGFTLQTIDTDEIVVNYPSIFELMRDLKAMGENNAAYNRQLHLSRDTQFAAASIYEKLYGKTDEKSKVTSVPATFQIIHLLGWKPDPSQAKPLARGSGEVSLKDLNQFNDGLNKK